MRSASRDAIAKKSAPDTAGDADAAADATTTPDAGSAPAGSASLTIHAAAQPDAATAATPATGQLAAGGADRQLDLARQGAWLDGLSRDIASAGDASSPLRFAVAPQHLGSVQVEMLRAGDGASVTLTASSDAARVALADARPLLVAEARAQGIHIASAQVDVGTQSGDSRSSSQGQPSESRPSSAASTPFSANANAQGGSGRQSQTQSQPLAPNHVRLNRTGDDATGPEPSLAADPADGLYA